MELDDVTNDRETQSKSAMRPRETSILLSESLEHVREEFLRNSSARVFYNETPATLVIRFHSDGNLPSRRSELDRVRQEIPRNLVQAVRVTLHEKLRTLEVAN